MADAPVDVIGSKLTDLSSAQAAAGQQLLAQQNAEQQGLFNQYQTAVNAQPTMEQSYTDLSNQYNVPGLQSQVTDLNSQISNVQKMINDLSTNVTARTKGTDTTEAQRQRQVAFEQTPLTQQLSDLGFAEQPLQSQLTTAQQNIATQLGLISADQQKALQPLIMQIDAESDKFARETSMFTSENENEFNSLADTLQNQQNLSDEQWARANQLADQATAFANQKELVQMQIAGNIQAAQVYGQGAAQTTASASTPKSAFVAPANASSNSSWFNTNTKIADNPYNITNLPGWNQAMSDLGNFGKSIASWF
jgi:hypothetical protein